MGGICSWEKADEAPDKARWPVKGLDKGDDITRKIPSETLEKLSDKKIKTMADHTTPLTLDAYNAERASVLAAERAEGFDGRARDTASELENKANEIVVAIRQRDAELVHGGGLDMLGKVMTPDKHFVGNASNITNTSLFKIAQQMPKGAHLHCHFNSCLPPQFLLRHAKNNAHMYIKSDLALTSEDNKERAEIQFQMHVIDEEKHLEPSISLVQESYKSSFHVDNKRKGWYSYDKFLQEYPSGEDAAEEWLASKLLFTEEEVYGISQTTAKSVTSITPITPSNRLTFTVSGYASGPARACSRASSATNPHSAPTPTHAFKISSATTSNTPRSGPTSPATPSSSPMPQASSTTRASSK